MPFKKLHKELSQLQTEFRRAQVTMRADALLDKVLQLVEAADRTYSEEALTLSAAAPHVCAHPDTVGRWVSSGRIPNYGSPNAPKVRISDIKAAGLSGRGPRGARPPAASDAASSIETILAKFRSPRASTETRPRQRRGSRAHEAA